MHERIGMMLEKRYRGVQMEMRLKPGQRGVDIEVLNPRDVSRTGFRFADIKPRTPSGQTRLSAQLEKWGMNAQEVRPITYDAKGNVYLGF
jgi:hypothetical protein